MSRGRRTALISLLAVLGIALAAAITWGTSQLVRQRIGLASEPLTAGRRLLPPVTGTATVGKVTVKPAKRKSGAASRGQPSTATLPTEPAAPSSASLAPVHTEEAAPAREPSSPSKPASPREKARPRETDSSRETASPTETASPPKTASPRESGGGDSRSRGDD
jgi:hypothetical protein